jgi:hypothetical protein
MAVITCLVGCVITMPVLFPINITGGAGSSQLDILSMSNVSNPWKFFAHAGICWIYFGMFSKCSRLVNSILEYKFESQAFEHPGDILTLLPGSLNP